MIGTAANGDLGPVIVRQMLCAREAYRAHGGSMAQRNPMLAAINHKIMPRHKLRLGIRAALTSVAP